MPQKTPSSPARRLAAKILGRVDRESAWAERLLNSAFIRQPGLSRKDRALCTELVYGTLRQQITLDALLQPLLQRPMDKQPAHLRVNLRLAAYQLLHTRIPPHAAVHEAVTLVRDRTPRLAGICNAVLRKFSKAMADDTLEWPEDLATRYGQPVWLAEELLRSHCLNESEMEALLRANNRRPDTHLRVNLTQTTEKKFRAALQNARLNDPKNNGAELPGTTQESASTPVATKSTPPKVKPSVHDSTPLKSARLKHAIRLNGAGEIGKLPGYHEGHFAVQDIGAQMVGLLAAPQAGDLVVDLCAAPGGKTTHLAELLIDAALPGKPPGIVLALDRHLGKTKLIHDNAERLKLTNVYTHVADAHTITLHTLIVEAGLEETLGEYAEKGADIVVLDAPCSGTGTLARNPELRHREDAEKKLGGLIKIQAGLLRNAARMVRPGGYLIYAVCSVLPKEAETQIVQFLNDDAGKYFSVEAPSEVLDELSPYESENVVKAQKFTTLRTWPHVHDTDGFFAVRLKRAENEEAVD